MLADEELAGAAAAHWLLNSPPGELLQAQLSLAAVRSGALMASLTGGVLLAVWVVELARIVPVA